MAPKGLISIFLLYQQIEINQYGNYKDFQVERGTLQENLDQLRRKKAETAGRLQGFENEVQRCQRDLGKIILIFWCFNSRVVRPNLFIHFHTCYFISFLKNSKMVFFILFIKILPALEILLFLFLIVKYRSWWALEGIFGAQNYLWIRGRPVRALSLVSKDSDFNPSVRPSVVKIANHC